MVSDTELSESYDSVSGNDGPLKSLGSSKTVSETGNYEVVLDSLFKFGKCFTKCSSLRALGWTWQ